MRFLYSEDDYTFDFLPRSLFPLSAIDLVRKVIRINCRLDSSSNQTIESAWNLQIVVRHGYIVRLIDRIYCWAEYHVHPTKTWMS
jgi:hypothetical protein